MDYFANWQITGVICMALLALSTGNDYHLTLTDEPVDQVFSENLGSNVTFECSTTGNPKPEVLWMRNNIPIVENSKYQMTKSGALVINVPVRSDHGDGFWCEARNTFGALRSQEATLEIAYVNVTPRRGITSVYINANLGKCLSCEPPDAYPGIQAQWRKQIGSGFDNIQPSRRLMILADGQLCFAYTKSTDSGRYDCSVANSYDRGQRLNFERSMLFSVTVTAARSDQALRAVNVSPNITVKRGEEAVLQCIFLGKPLPTLQWTRSDRPIDGGILVNGHQLRIPDAQPDDSGEYSCTATKPSSNTQTNVQYLTVISPPILTTELNDTEVSRLSSVSFRCESDNPGDEYAWYYNAEPITFNGRVQRKSPNAMFITSTQATDSGIYQCSVNNSFGAVFSTAQLRIRDPRDHNQQDQNNSVNDHNQQDQNNSVNDTKNNEHSQEKGPDTKDNEHNQERGPDGNSSVTLTGSTLLLLIVMMYQKVL